MHYMLLGFSCFNSSLHLLGDLGDEAQNSSMFLLHGRTQGICTPDFVGAVRAGNSNQQMLLAYVVVYYCPTQCRIVTTTADMSLSNLEWMYEW